jgi:hypothetical protein
MNLGEIALNTADGKVFMKKNDGSVYEVSYRDIRVADYLGGGGFTGDINTSGNITLGGNLTVNGTTTTVNSTVVTIDDKLIELGATATPTDTTADGGGISLKGSTDKTITWRNSDDRWVFDNGDGTNYVLPINFTDLTDVTISGLDYGQLVKYDVASGQFVNSKYLGVTDATDIFTFARERTQSQEGVSDIRAGLIIEKRITDATTHATDDGGVALAFGRSYGATGNVTGYAQIGARYYGTTNAHELVGLISTNNLVSSTEVFRSGVARTTFQDKLYIDSVNGRVGIMNTSPAVELDVTGSGRFSSDLAVNGGDLTTTSSSFNLLNSPTVVNVFNAATNLTVAATSGTTTIRNNLVVDGTVSFGSVGSLSDNLTLSGDLAVDGGDITTTSATFNLLPNNATTVNFATSATTLEVGAATGTTNINNNLDVDGNALVNGDLTVDGTIHVQAITNDDNSKDSGNLTITANNYVVIDSNGNGQIEIGRSSGVGRVLLGSAITGVTIGDTGGDVDIKGNTLDVTVNSTTLSGDLAVNGGDITTTASSFNLLNTAATTLNAFGAATNLTLAATTGTTTVRNNLVIDGTVAVSGTSTFTGNTTITGNLAVNGGDLTTSASAFNLLNANAITVNAFGAATSIDIGAATGTTSINNSLTVDGNASVVGTLGVTGETTLASATVSDLTSGRIVFVGTAGSLVDSGNLTWDGFSVNVNGNVEARYFNAINGVNLNYTTTNAIAYVNGSYGLESNSNLGWNGTTLAITGNQTLSGTLAVTGNTTMTGDLAVNGGDLTTTASSFNLLNSNSTTVNAFGAATTIEIGAATGTTNINNNLDVDGDVNIDGGDLTVSTSTFNLANTSATTINAFGAATAINLGAATGTTTFNNNQIIFNSTDSIQIPVGTTAQRDSTPAVGQIRYNTTTSSFEGYGPGSSWGSLGGVRDVDGNTYIIPELSAGSNENTLFFYNNGVNTLNVTETSLDLKSAISSITTAASSINLVNANATTVNFAQAGTTITMGATTGTTRIRNNLQVDGTISFASTAAITDNLTLSGDLAVNGGDITTTASSFNLLNSNATAVTAFGAATSLILGASSGTTTVANNLAVSGNLTVSGTTTTINTETINLADNIILLNSNATGTPSENAGIEINRGADSNVQLRWNETTDKWEATRDGTNFVVLPINTSELAEDPAATVTSGTMYYTNARARNSISVTDSGGDGSLSYNSSTGVITYTGPSATEVRAHISVSDAGGDGSLSYNSSTGVITYTGPSAAEVRAHISVSDAGGDGSLSYNSSTGVITYTGPSAAEVRAHISVSDAGGDGSLSYDNTTGIITYTGPNASEVRAHFTAGTGVSISSGQISIGQAVGTTSNVTFNKVNVGTAGIAFPTDAFGGSGDTATITLTAASGEAQRMTFTVGNDADDMFNFVAPSNNGLLMNGNTVWNSGNVSNGTGISLSGTTITNTGVTGLTAGTGVSVSAGTGSITVSNSGVTGLSGTSNQVNVSGSTGSVTLSLPQSIATGSSVQFGSLGVGTGASGTSGEIRATNEITAYYSDKRLKENIQPIEDALHRVLQLHGVTYTANDIAESFGYKDKKKQVGLLAQDVKTVLPEVVVRAPFDIKVVDGKETSKSGEDYMTIKYEKLVALLVEAVKELNDKVETLEAQLSAFKSL